MNIKQHFLPYEEALALKELGFNQPTFAYYQYSEFYKELCRLREIQGWLYDNNIKQPETEKDCLSPTFKQAFQFFREKYNLQAIISYTEYAIKSYNAFKYTLSIPTNLLVWEGEYKTYEEAQLACIQKLIKLAKT